MRHGKVREMLKDGVPIDSINEYGDMAINLAAYKNYTDVIQVLQENGAMLNIQTDDGVTPLHATAWDNSTDVMKDILKQGA